MKVRTTVDNGRIIHMYEGLSSETKPTTGVLEYSKFLAADLNKMYTWQNGAWANDGGGIYRNAVPTTGTWTVGDEVDNIAPTRAKNIAFWRCVTAGTPGTWYAYGTGWGLTTERPTLTANDAGYTFFDTTLAKMILWNGSTWQV